MKAFILFFLFSCFALSAFAQDKMIVFFTDKGDSPFMELSDRAKARRLKNDAALNEKDRLLNVDYLNLLSEDGEVLNHSRWLNAVTFESSKSVSSLKEKHPFIHDIWLSNPTTNIRRKDLVDYSNPKTLNYGVADTQARQIGADCMHDLGYTGEGVYLAILDAGFRGMDTISYFDSLFNQGRVLETFDFTNNASVYNYSLHGTAVSSCIFAHKGGVDPYAGTAVNVDVALYVTEDVTSESLVEEFNLVTALERCDQIGVDIANISLGYVSFDDPNENHLYPDLDGQTTIAAIGVNTAVSKGIVVVAAAGNSGPSYISTPCDADSCLCVGGVDNEGLFASFSSLGPASDGAIKPDVVGTGQDTWVILDDGSLVMGNGTSFASPIVAGGVACLIEANPTSTAMEIMQSVQQSSHQYTTPDEFMGYGIPDFCLANTTMGLLTGESEDYRVYPIPTNSTLIIEGLNQSNKFKLVNSLGQEISVASSKEMDGTIQVDVSNIASGIYLLKINDLFVVKRVVIQH